MNRAVVGSDCQRGQGPSFLTTMLRGGTGNEVEREERGIWKRGGKRDEGDERRGGNKHHEIAKGCPEYI